MGQLEMNRRGRRAIQGGGIGHIGRAKTGTPAHFAGWKSNQGSWKERRAVRKHLRNMTLVWLAEQLDVLGGAKNLGMGRTLRKLSAKYANVLELSETTAEEILAVPLVGRQGVQTLEEYLRSKQVPLAWTVKRGD